MPWTLGVIEVGVIPDLPLRAYLPDAPADATISPPSFSYMATDGRRVVVIDTGSDPARCARAGFDIEGEPAELLRAGLAACRIDPARVELVVHTHLHYDHIGNDSLFPNAAVVVQRAELDWATGLHGDPFYLGVDDLVAELGDRLRPLDGEARLFPGLTAVPSGGHTPGHQSVLAETADGPVCVCGDVVSLRRNTEIVGSVCPDAAAARAFLARARRSGWELLPSHDPEMRRHRLYVASDTGVMRPFAITGGLDE